MDSLSFIPGKALLVSDSPFIPWFVVFEDEGPAGYFYACDRTQAPITTTSWTPCSLQHARHWRPRRASPPNGLPRLSGLEADCRPSSTWMDGHRRCSISRPPGLLPDGLPELPFAHEREGWRRDSHAWSDSAFARVRGGEVRGRAESLESGSGFTPAREERPSERAHDGGGDAFRPAPAFVAARRGRDRNRAVGRSSRIWREFGTRGESALLSRRSCQSCGRTIMPQAVHLPSGFRDALSARLGDPVVAAKRASPVSLVRMAARSSSRRRRVRASSARLWATVSAPWCERGPSVSCAAGVRT